MYYIYIYISRSRMDPLHHIFGVRNPMGCRRLGGGSEVKLPFSLLTMEHSNRFWLIFQKSGVISPPRTYSIPSKNVVGACPKQKWITLNDWCRISPNDCEPNPWDPRNCLLSLSLSCFYLFEEIEGFRGMVHFFFQSLFVSHDVRPFVFKQLKKRKGPIQNHSR